MTHWTKIKKADFGKIKYTKSRKKRDLGVSYMEKAISFDIESSSFERPIYENDEILTKNGKTIYGKYAYCYIWQFAIDEKVFFGRYLSEFVEFLSLIKNLLGLNEKKKIIIYVHNLSYEFQFIKEYFNITEMFATDPRTPLYCELNNCFVLKCSYLLTNKSLAKLAEETPYKKMCGDLDYKLLRHSETVLTEKELDYCKFDVLIITYYIEKQMIKEGSILKIPLTSTGYVRRDFLSYLNDTKSKNSYDKKYKPVIELNPDLFNILHKAFSGGFTHANYIHSDLICYNVSSIDFTSSYPFCICGCKFPMKKFQKINISTEKELINLIKKGYACCFTAIFKDIKAKGNINILSFSKCIIPKNDKNLNKDNGRIISADFLQTTITDIDYQMIKLFYNFSDMVVSDCYISLYEYLPKQLIEVTLKYYTGKTTLKDVEGKEEEYLLLKALLNSLYGMCVTNPLNDEIIYFNENERSEDYDYKDWICKENSENEIAEKLEKFNKSYSSVLSYAWGVWITAHARKHLLLSLNHFQDDYIYSDTDSVKFYNYEKHKDFIERFNNNLVKKSYKCLDFWKIDKSLLSPKSVDGKEHQLGIFSFEGTYTYFKTLGAKRYINSKNNELTVTISGVSKYGFYRFCESIYGGKAEKKKYIAKSEKDIIKIFDMFEDGLKIPKEYSGKLIHRYTDESYKFNISDYNGKISEVSAKSFIHLSESEYELGLSVDYVKLIERFNFENKSRLRG